MAADSLPAVILAAGRSTRMDGNKLLAEWQGRPLVRHAVQAAVASRARPVLVVVGHQADGVRAALAGLAVTFVDNPAFAEGMASSLRAGIAALPATAAGVLVGLGDMPLLKPDHYDRLLDAFTPDAAAVLPVVNGRRGHPVLLARALFSQVMTLTGDEGARRLLTGGVVEVGIDDPAVLRDVDTPEALRALTGG